jgi:hypothetical protein
MAIIKPNNNTISAITALPNGIVSSAALASGVGGKVLQTVTASSNTNTDTNSTSFVATQITANITPSATSSKIFVSVCSDIDDIANGVQAFATIYRDSTNLAGGNSNFGNCMGADSRVIAPISMTTLDSPSSTSQLTYKAYIKSGSGSTTVKFNNQDVEGTIVLMEIAG